MNIDIAVQEIDGVLHVHGLGVSLVLINVDDDDLLAEALVDDAVGRGRADVACAHDGDFRILEAHDSSPL